MAETMRAGPLGRLRGSTLDAVISSALVAAAFFLRVVNYQAIIAYPDEFVYLDRALATIGYNWNWSPAFMLDQPPLYMYLLSIIISLSNSQLGALRLLSVVAGSLTVYFVYLLGNAMFSRRVGLIAGIVFAFNGFDILYSRLAQQESLTIFFMTGALYFFWTGVAGKRKLWRALMGGVFLGLGLDTKYVALILPVTYLLYFFVVGNDWRHIRLMKRDWWKLLLSKEFAVLIVTAVLILSPVLYELHLYGVDAFYWDLLGKFASSYSPFFRSYPLEDILFSAFSSYTTVLSFVSTFNSSQVFPIYDLYAALTFFSLVMVLTYYLRALIRLRERETFLALLFGVSAMIFLVYPNRFQYYELYTFPAYPLMFAFLLDRAIARLAAPPGRKFRAVRPTVILTFSVLFLVLSMGMIAGTASAVSGQGAFDQLGPFFQYVKEHHEPGLSIAVTPIGNVGYISYYLSRMNVTANIISLAGVASAAAPPSTQILEVPLQSNWIYSIVVTLQPLTVFHPQYVVLTQAEYDGAFTTAMKIYLAQNYFPVMTSQGFVLLQRIGSGT